jgi:hypothetical protein
MYKDSCKNRSGRKRASLKTPGTTPGFFVLQNTAGTMVHTNMEQLSFWKKPFFTPGRCKVGRKKQLLLTGSNIFRTRQPLLAKVFKSCRRAAPD